MKMMHSGGERWSDGRKRVDVESRPVAQLAGAKNDNASHAIRFQVSTTCTTKPTMFMLLLCLLTDRIARRMHHVRFKCGGRQCRKWSS